MHEYVTGEENTPAQALDNASNILRLLLHSAPFAPPWWVGAVMMAQESIHEAAGGLGLRAPPAWDLDEQFVALLIEHLMRRYQSGATTPKWMLN